MTTTDKNLIVTEEKKPNFLRVSTYQKDGTTTYALVEIVPKVKKPKKEKDTTPYESLGQLKQIPTATVLKDDKGDIVRSPAVSKRGEAAVAEYRRVKALLDANSKIKFRELPSLKLTAEERKLKMEKYKADKKTVKAVKNVEQAKSYTKAPFEVKHDKKWYDGLRKSARESQIAWQDAHSKKIEIIRLRLFSKDIEIVKVDSNEIDSSTGILKREVVGHSSKEKAITKVRKIANASTNPPTKHVFGIDSKDNIPFTGHSVKRAA